MIKLIATDIDGTVVKDGTLQIDPEYMTVVDKLIRKGIHIVVCSGRQFVSEQKLFAPIRDELFHTQIGVGNWLDGGRRRVKKYLWSF